MRGGSGVRVVQFGDAGGQDAVPEMFGAGVRGLGA